MPDSPPPETLVWLRHAASCGQRDAQLTLHILKRLEALEQRPIPGTVELAAPTPEAAPVATDEEIRALYGLPGTFAEIHRAIYNLGRQHGAAQPPVAQPAPAIFPVEYADANGDGIRILMEPSGDTGQACWVVRNSRRVDPLLEFSTPEAAHAAHQAPQPAPPVAPARGLVERVVNVLGHYGDGTARAAIREVAAWIRSELNGRSVADRLELEADR
jgi:hypothetical protein